MKTAKKLCSISVDVDPLWTYFREQKTNGSRQRTEGGELDIIAEISIPRFLQIFKKFNIAATFFIVGKSVNKALLKKIKEDGHELANHTMNHILNWNVLSSNEKEREIKEAEDTIIDSVNEKPVGFRTPGWNIDTETIGILQKMNYIYDSSIHPTVLIPFMKLKKILQSNNEGKIMGSIFYLFAPNYPYFPSKENVWQKNNNKNGIVEIPITVTPFLRLPFYGTTMFYFGKNYFRFFYPFLRRFINFLNLEFHSIELVDFKKDGLTHLSDMEKHPVTDISLEDKIEIMEVILKRIKRDWQITTLKETVRRHLTI